MLPCIQQVRRDAFAAVIRLELVMTLLDNIIKLPLLCLLIVDLLPWVQHIVRQKLRILRREIDQAPITIDLSGIELEVDNFDPISTRIMQLAFQVLTRDNKLVACIRVDYHVDMLLSNGSTNSPLFAKGAHELAAECIGSHIVEVLICKD